MFKESFDAYNDYLGVKLHFNDAKFIFKPDKQLGTIESFSKRKDSGMFQRFGRKYPKQDGRIELLTTGFLEDNRIWLNSILGDELEETHLERMKRRKAIQHNFNLATESLSDYIDNNECTLKSLLKTNDDMPEIMRINLISLENLSILDYYFDFTRFPSKNILWEANRLKISKYKYMLGLGEFKLDKNIKKLIALNRVNPTFST